MKRINVEKKLKQDCERNSDQREPVRPPKALRRYLTRSSNTRALACYSQSEYRTPSHTERHSSAPRQCPSDAIMWRTLTRQPTTSQRTRIPQLILRRLEPHLLQRKTAKILIQASAQLGTSELRSPDSPSSSSSTNCSPLGPRPRLRPRCRWRRRLPGAC